MEFKPDHPYLLNYLGYSWADQGKKLDKALELVKKAAALKPDDGYIVDSLGWVYFKLGQYGEATKALEKAVEMVPYDATINDHLGDTYWKVGRKTEARFMWQRALNHSDDDKQKAELNTKISDGLTDQTPAVMEAKSAKPEAAPQQPAAPVKN
jgi:tetratricopeptide (TPR) repeat protein